MQFSTLFLASLVSANIFANTVEQTLALDGLDNPDVGRNDIKYTPGKRVLTGDVNLYHIYYGAWTDAQKALIDEFANGLGASSWYTTTKLYYSQSSTSANKQYVNGKVSVVKSVSDTGSFGTSLSGNNLPDLIQKFISAGSLPNDPNGIYFILTSGEISESIRPDLGTASFCSDYCGYHVTSTPTGSSTRVQYAMVGNPTACLSGCAAPENQSVSPNGDLGVDAVFSIYAHELTEAISDPTSDVDAERAWQDAQGSENADKCAYKYGLTKKDSNGATYNLSFGGKNYLVQQNWSPVTQNCVQHA